MDMGLNKLLYKITSCRNEQKHDFYFFSVLGAVCGGQEDNKCQQKGLFPACV